MKTISRYDFEEIKSLVAKGVCDDFSGFCAYIGIFTNYNEFLNLADSNTKGDMEKCWPLHKVNEWAIAAEEKGILLALPIGFVYANYFTRFRDTTKYDFSPILEEYSEWLGVDLDGQVIKDNGQGTLAEFHAILKACLADYNALDVKIRKRAQTPITAALEKWQAEIIKKQKAKGVGGNGICTRSTSRGIGNEYPVTSYDTPYHKETPKESEKSITEEVLADWAMQYRQPMDDLGRNIKTIYQASLSEEQIREIYHRIPNDQFPKKFKALFAESFSQDEE